MPKWDKTGRPQFPYTDAERRRGLGMKACKRCKGAGRVPGLLFAERRCPKCKGEGQVPTAATLAMLRRMRRDWDYKMRVAAARDKVALKHDAKRVR
jgi:DnaJ-class molecular chaperone